MQSIPWQVTSSSELFSGLPDGLPEGLPLGLLPGNGLSLSLEALGGGGGPEPVNNVIGLVI